MAFRPQVNQQLSIEGVTYRIGEHPSAPGMPYGQEGRRAVVYQLIAADGNRRALKVFKPRFSVPRMVAVAERLRPYGRLPGLQVCERTVLTASRHRDVLAQHPDLAYAVLMPWVEGPTWQEILLSAKDPSWSPITAEESLRLARGLAEVLVALEERGLAHCDLSGPNLIVMPGTRAALVDLEEMCGPGFVQPKILPAGSPGYAHKSAPHGLWNDDADRFAGAVLLVEMLGWCDPRVREAAWGESYFPPDEMQRTGGRYTTLHGALESRWGGRLADLFAAVWRSDSLAVCPTFAAWLVALPDEVPSLQPEVAAVAPAPSSGAAAGRTSGAGLLILKAQGAADAGDTEGAIALYREALTGATPEMAGLIQGRIAALMERQELGKPAAGWVCPSCGETVSDDLQICPYCEQGSRQVQAAAPAPQPAPAPAVIPPEPLPQVAELPERRPAASRPRERAAARVSFSPVLALALSWGCGLLFSLIAFLLFRDGGGVFLVLGLLGLGALGGTLGLFLKQIEPALGWKQVLLLTLLPVPPLTSGLVHHQVSGTRRSEAVGAHALGMGAGIVGALAAALGTLAIGYALDIPFLVRRSWGLPVIPYLMGALVGAAVMGMMLERYARRAQLAGRGQRIPGERPVPNRIPLAVSGALVLIMAVMLGGWWFEPLPAEATSPPEVEMALIPAGPFQVGSKGGDLDESAIHPVLLDAYAIDVYEVTNAEYAAFLNDRGNQIETFIYWYDVGSDGSHIARRGGEWVADPDYTDHPVGNVSWYGARAFCGWRGGRLPTEAEWEKAARGTDGRTYPWGEGIDCGRANYAGCRGDTAAVGSYPNGSSPYGVLDMAGNAWEWVSDWYDQDYYSLLSARSRNPVGPSSGTRKVIRGGSWTANANLARSSNRLGEFATTRHPTIGFRCAAAGVGE
jgi:formylglycine-generating enzyme required for sulfatase activity